MDIYNCSTFCDPGWLYHIHRRAWYFTSNGGGQRETLAGIIDDGGPRIYDRSLPEVAVKKPATLILKNVDLRYNSFAFVAITVLELKFWFLLQVSVNFPSFKETYDIYF